MPTYPSALLPPGRRSGPPHAGSGVSARGTSELPLDTTILIVEDEVMIAWMIESLLEDMGFGDIHMASSGCEAERKASALPPGLLISDINLGDGPDGVDAAVAMNAARALPVLFVTAYADDATRERIAAALPRALILRKPMQAADLLAALHTLLGRKPS